MTIRGLGSRKVTRGTGIMTSCSRPWGAKAFRRNDTDTLIGMIFLLLQHFERAPSFVFFIFTIYPSEMILVRFPPCTGSGSGARPAKSCMF